jgi:hypothetical protein
MVEKVGLYWHFVDLVWVFVLQFLSSLIFKSFIMSHEHEYVSNTGKIWKVFGILSLVTIIEVILGILKPESLHFTNFQ